MTNPLTKSIKTLEGILVVVSDVVIAAVAVIPSHGLPGGLAAGLIVAQHVALLTQRGVIKARALSSSHVAYAIGQNLFQTAVSPSNELADLGAIAKQVEQEVVSTPSVHVNAPAPVVVQSDPAPVSPAPPIQQ